MKIRQIWIVLVVIGVIYFGIKMQENRKVAEQITKEQTVDEAVEIILNETKGRLPLQVDEYTALTDIKYNKQKRLITYVYEIAGIDQLTQKEIDEVAREIKQKTTEQFLTSSKNADILSTNTSMEFVYNDINRNKKFSFTLTPKDLQGKN